MSVTEAGGAFLIDVDGTLVDTNYHHAIAWYRAFRRHEVTLPLWRIHRAMGMGGDQLVVPDRKWRTTWAMRSALPRRGCTAT